MGNLRAGLSGSQAFLSTLNALVGMISGLAGAVGRLSRSQLAGIVSEEQKGIKAAQQYQKFLEGEADLPPGAAFNPTLGVEYRYNVRVNMNLNNRGRYRDVFFTFRSESLLNATDFGQVLGNLMDDYASHYVDEPDVHVRDFEVLRIESGLRG